MSALEEDGGGPKFRVNSELSYQKKSCSECQQDVRKQYFNMSICPYVNMSTCQHVSMSICQYVRMQLFSLVIKMKVVQNVKTISENIISVCQHVSMSICPYVNMSICQNATFQLRYQNESCSKCHQEKVVLAQLSPDDIWNNFHF